MKTRLNDLFDGIEKEEGNKLDDRINVEQDPALEELLELYSNFRDNVNKEEIGNLLLSLFLFRKIKMRQRNRIEYKQTFNEAMSEEIKNTYTAKQITKFSYLLTDDAINHTGAENTGFFLNHIIQQSPDYNHTLNLQHIDTKIYGIGWYNTKDITINGSLGSYIGDSMTKGKITINGNCEDALGFFLAGGQIIVNGNTGKDTGHGMSGGKIKINGDIETIGEINSIRARIYQNNVPKVLLGIKTPQALFESTQKIRKYFTK